MIPFVVVTSCVLSGLVFAVIILENRINDIVALCLDNKKEIAELRKKLG